jgi:riboflavin synthase
MTVEDFEDQGEEGAWLVCTAGHETLAITTLGQLKEGSRVNLERALGLGDRMGGHLVSGHVDAMVKVLRFEQVGVGWDLDLELAPEMRHNFVLKGSVAINGVSLTVAHLDETSFGIMLIPHTLEVTTLVELQPGDFVNIEMDMIGKYVARMLGSAGLIDAPTAPLEDLLQAPAPMKDDV